MFDFGGVLDLDLIWFFIIGIAIFAYVLLDGFDLGIGILFPFAPSEKCRDRMMNSIAPFWDGNETWLVLGAGGLFAAFPTAYAILMPAFYIPIIFMLIGLIFRGIAFEFRFKASKKNKHLWDYAFHFGSLLATIMQGMILGNFIQGVTVKNHAFAGHPFDWISAFSVMTSVALVFGYSLIGSTWLVMKTDDVTQEWSRRVSKYVIIFVGFFMFLVSITVPSVDPIIVQKWFTLPNFLYLLPIPILATITFVYLIIKINSSSEKSPFVLTIFLFFLNYVGFGVSIWPWIVPFKVTYWEAAANSHSLSFLLTGTILLLPAILCYTFYCYYIFKGKTGHERHY